jgi:uncharacterized protein (DUF1810 family)
MADDRFDLERFLQAQAGGVYERALGELRRGRKQGHWMWFVFPQLAGLGRSPTAQAYAIGSLEEARSYLAHPVVGARLREASRALLDLSGADAEAVLGAVDAMKLRSSMTLFDRAAADETLFGHVLSRFYDGEPDARTLELLERGPASRTTT